MPRRAFTLLELLVCLAVLALLLALLLPALARVRARGRDAACLAQLHQIALADAEYHSAFRLWPEAPWQLRDWTDDELHWTCPGDPKREALYRVLAGAAEIGAAYSHASWSNRIDAEPRPVALVTDPLAGSGEAAGSFHGPWFNAGFTDGHAGRVR